MVIFRHHKGSLAESMATAVEFNNYDELKAYIVEYYKKFYKELGYETEPISLEDVVIEEDEKHDDKRIGWHNTMYVCIKRLGNEDYMKEYNSPQCIGMCATDY
jgi:hypothetical protein